MKFIENNPKKKVKKCAFCGRKIKNDENFYPRCKEFRDSERRMFRFFDMPLPEDLIDRKISTY